MSEAWDQFLKAKKTAIVVYINASNFPELLQ